MPVRSSSLILDVLGMYVRPIGNWIAVADLVRLMEELGVESAPTRSAISRLARQGTIASVVRDGVRGYSLPPAAIPAMERADRRILGTVPPASIDGEWLLVSFSVPESRRSERDHIRRRLRGLGFGNLSGGTWIAPAHLEDELEAVFDELGLPPDTEIFIGRLSPRTDAAAMVARAWDLSHLRNRYQAFLERTSPVLERWEGRTNAVTGDEEHEARGQGEHGHTGGTDTAAFVDFTTVVHHWREIPYLDPGLPRGLLPPDWPGIPAVGAFARVRELLEAAAHRHVAELTAAHREGVHR